MRHALALFLPVLGLVFALPGGVDAQVVSVKNSKHNLSSVSSSGTGSIKAATSGGTTEICVFCHTPHSANAQAPLWNRKASIATYQTYTSDVLAGLNYYGAEDPSNPGAPGYNVHVKSRLCLSCHDGTIALGNLVNLPYDPTSGKLTGDVKMVNANADGTMPTGAAGYMGIDLQDDHPIAIPHDNAGTKDPELRGTITGGSVYLYQYSGGAVRKTNLAGSANYVECTSCHNAHDNQFGYFLVESNIGSQLCIDCHNKQTSGATPAHDNGNATTVLYNFDGNSPTTHVADVKCMNCHYSHKAGVNPSTPTQPNTSYGKYLLAYQEEATCFNATNRWGKSVSACHGTTQWKDIQTQQLKASAHVYSFGAGKHQATEAKTYGWLGSGNTNWHVECNDCHNSHTAGATKHAAPGNAIGNTSPLYGTGGVSITWSGFWASPGAGGFSPFESLGLTLSTNMPLNYYEYQVCLKCHSSFAWGTGSPPGSPSLGVGQLMTDQAVEFNPGNVRTAGANGASMHPVAGVTGNTLYGTLLAPWAASRGNQTMYCSDCHNTSDASPAPQGPHGSANGSLLSTAYSNTYTTTTTAVQSSGLGLSDDLCFKCHSESVYQSGAATLAGTGFFGTTTNLHTQHRIRSSASTTSTYGYRCVNCHTRLPHGFNRKAMVVQRGDGSPYEAGGTNGGKIVTFTPGASNAYLVGYANRNSNCSTVNGCHQ